MSLLNKVVIVTGASSGIGANIAIKFSEQGAKLAIVGRNKMKLKNISDICEKHGSKPLIIIADVTKHTDVKRIVDETLTAYGAINILINSAGINENNSILDENAMEAFDRVINTNLRSAVYLTHLAAKYVIETEGNIINISSIAAQSVITKASFAYCTSKAGLDHFTRSIALELGSKGVRVNAINPGPVKTDIIENMGVDKPLADSLWESMKPSTLLNRVSEPDEIGDLAVFLASDKGRSITGATLVIDNGTMLMGPMDNKN